ncbi:type I restriction-modification system subunit M [Billgrantia saliphila]|uniref:type I restriction-modification system subunit M n=1 Tax=Billgrantia saliphila TaxID=1848458 RepID=UPI000CE3BA39|nr:class I SAM-dependent DNA methyltransferase [Halomonas saliphila]
MALKKSQLYSSLWQSCDELRGGMDASQYKDYVLTLLFMKYVSDKKDSLIEVPEGGSFADMVALKGDKEIGDKINMIIRRLAEANDLKGVIDQADFNDETRLGSGKDMQDRLSKLVAIFDQLDLGANRADGDDLLGDAYEYLMRHFATESGKSKGQFYTPGEVSRVIAQVVGIGPSTRPDETIYDPTCGSGSLLLRAAYEAPDGMSIYGQENDIATWALAKMNMILHDYPTAEIWRGNTLSSPYFKNNAGPQPKSFFRDGEGNPIGGGADNYGGLKTFDYAVANPPFSAKSWSNGLDPEHDEFGRFEYGIPPAKNGDYAFLLHMIKSLKSTGKGAIILPHGVLFRGNKEADIRRNLVKRGLIKGVIGLPANLFYGTGIPACILIIDKEHAQARRGIFMVDASREYVKDGNKNRLRSRDIHKIVDVFNHQKEVPGYSRLVSLNEIASESNGYNLNIPRYIDAGEREDLHDLDAHLNGGIPQRDVDALQPYWSVLPDLREALFQDSGRPGYLEAKVETQQVKPTVLTHPDFQAFAGRVNLIIESWQSAHWSLLMGLTAGIQPRQVIHELSEDLLERFASVPLLDRYAVYQRLMDYWAGVMQDDVYLIAAEGWQEAARPRGVIENKERKIKEEPDLVIGNGKKARKYKLDLVPPTLVIARYFAEEQAQLERLQAESEAATRELEEFIEEQDGEEDPLSEVKNDKGKVTKTEIPKRLKALKGEPDSDEEIVVLRRCQKLLDAEASAKKAAKDAEAELNQAVLARYGELTEYEIKWLVVDDKWLADIRAAIEAEVERITNRLAGRVRELEERYAEPLPSIEREVEALTRKVTGHLETMGVCADV